MTLAIDEVQVAYCREARRLRWVHATRPVRKLRAIADLSARYDTTARPAPAVESFDPAAIPTRVTVRPVAASPRAIFAEKVAAEMAGEVLRYSQRQALLAQASRLGIGRFEANLVIAEAEHEIPPAPPTNEKHSDISPLALVGLALFLESIAALAIYRLLM